MGFPISAKGNPCFKDNNDFQLTEEEKETIEIQNRLGGGHLYSVKDLIRGNNFWTPERVRQCAPYFVNVVTQIGRTHKDGNVLRLYEYGLKIQKIYYLVKY
ncbi:MAG: hypothetical protein ABJB85_10260 [Nitrososphaerota archaeon]